MLPKKEGQRVPNVTFKTRQNDQWVDVKSSDLFDGKTVVVLRLGIHPEMERPAILNRSIPSTAGATIDIPPPRTIHEVPCVSYLQL